jgi:protein-tyrosine-phosphatase
MPPALSSKLEQLCGGAARRLEPLLVHVLDLGPVRSALRRRAMRAWTASEAPLIVCFGNINRSPYAAALARQRGTAGAHSAGLYPVADRPSPPLTVEVAKTMGVDLDGHRSVIVDGPLVRDAPAIFVFDIENVVRLGLRVPAAIGKTHLLGLLAHRGPSIVPDPHGRDRAFLEGVLSQIRRAIDDVTADAGP